MQVRGDTGWSVHLDGLRSFIVVDSSLASILAASFFLSLHYTTAPATLYHHHQLLLDVMSLSEGSIVYYSTSRYHHRVNILLRNYVQYLYTIQISEFTGHPPSPNV